MKKLLFIILLFMSINAYSADVTRYVDFTDGNDGGAGHDGSTPALAWLTTDYALSQTAGATSTSDVKIYFRGGQTESAGRRTFDYDGYDDTHRYSLIADRFGQFWSSTGECKLSCTADLVFIMQNKDFITIRGFEFSYSVNTDLNGAIYNTGTCANVIIEECFFHDIVATNANLYNFGGIFWGGTALNSSTAVIIRNCIFANISSNDWYTAGVMAYACGYMYLYNNTFYNIVCSATDHSYTQAGFVIYGTNVSPTTVIAKNNIFMKCSLQLIKLSWANAAGNVVFTGNNNCYYKDGASRTGRKRNDAGTTINDYTNLDADGDDAGWRSISGDAASVEIDPLLETPATTRATYKIQGISGCINTGAAGLVTYDNYERLRLIGCSDIGAYQYKQMEVR